MRSIVAHEIEGHYLRKLNGKNMQYTIFKQGAARYLEIDEGIAIYNQNRFLNTFDRKYYGIFELLKISLQIIEKSQKILPYIAKYSLMVFHL